MQVPIKIESKLPHVATTIFTTVSAAAAEHGAINLAQGFPNFDCYDALKACVNEALFSAKNQYAPMPGLMALRETIAQKFYESQLISVHPDTEITITAGATQALFTAIATFIRANDEVIVIEPAYDSYAPAIEALGGKVVTYTTLPPVFHLDWQQLKTLVSDKTKMIIINTPGNPSTKIFSKQDFEMLASIVEDTNILILSDEVYEHLVYDGMTHLSALSIDALRHRTLAVYSFGKTYHSTGWKIGYCVGCKELMSEFRKVHQFNVFCVNSFVQHGLAKYMTTGQTWQALPTFYQSKRDFALECLKGSNYHIVPSQGSFFMLADYSKISVLNDMDFVNHMIIEKRVALIPLSAFYKSYPRDLKYVRICFAKTEDVLREGLGYLV